MRKKFQTKSVFISGANGYLGSRLSWKLAEKGYELLLSSKSDRELASLAAQICHKFPGTKVSTIAVDLTEICEWEKLSSFLEQSSSQHYINCTGLQGIPSEGLKPFNLEEFRKVMNVNLESSIFLTLHFANIWDLNQKHSIIHFSGGGATTARPLFDAYSLSKTALVRFVENVSKRPEFRNISVNAIAPGLMPSRMQESILKVKELRDTSEYANAIKSFDQENEFTNETIELCEFLLEEKSYGISGKIISARWDNWREWPNNLNKLINSDLYTLRRITGKDRGQSWGDRE